MATLLVSLFLALVSSVIVACVASQNERLLFNKAIEVRRDVKAQHRQDLRESLKSATAQDSAHLRSRILQKSDHSSFRQQIFGQRGRQLQDAFCSFDSVLEGHCTIRVFCTDLGLDERVNAYCLGDPEGSWKIVTRDEEKCSYSASEVEEDMPYDAAWFNPDTDYCWKEGSTFFMNQYDAEGVREENRNFSPF